MSEFESDAVFHHQRINKIYIDTRLSVSVSVSVSDGMIARKPQLVLVVKSTNTHSELVFQFFLGQC